MASNSATARPEEKAIASSPHHDAETALTAASTDKDLAINLVGEHAQEIDPRIEAKVVRRIDWFLIPAMIVGMSNSPSPRPPASLISSFSNTKSSDSINLTSVL